jgi:hypothetical protein
VYFKELLVREMRSIIKAAIRGAAAEIEKITRLIHSPAYKEHAKMRPEDFTRKRKMTFVDVIMYLI